LGFVNETETAADSACAMAGDSPGQFESALFEFSRRSNPVHKTRRQRISGAENLSSEGQRDGAPFADCLGDRLENHERPEAQVDVGEPESRVLGCYNKMAVGYQAGAPRNGRSMHGANQGLCETRVHGEQEFLGGTDCVDVTFRQFLQIHAGTEGFASAGKQDRAHGVVLAGPIERVDEIVAQFSGKRIALRRTIQPEPQYTAFLPGL